MMDNKEWRNKKIEELLFKAVHSDVTAEISEADVIQAKKIVKQNARSSHEFFVIFASLNLLNAAIKRPQYKKKLHYSEIKGNVSRLLQHLITLDFKEYNVAFYIALKISKQSPVLFITFSMSAKVVIKRINAFLTGISFKNNDNFSESEKLIFQDLADEIGKYEMHLSDDCHRNIGAIKDLCIQQVKENEVRCIFIDNIQNINSSKYYQNRHQELEYIMHELKQLAKQLDICIILDSQLSRAVETRGGIKRPMMSDLRDSGALENIADKVLFIYRPEYYEIMQDEDGNDTRGTAEIIISKNTSGPIGTAKLAFIGRTASFRDIDDTEIVPFESSFTFDNRRLKDLDETPF